MYQRHLSLIRIRSFYTTACKLSIKSIPASYHHLLVRILIEKHLETAFENGDNKQIRESPLPVPRLVTAMEQVQYIFIYMEESK